MQIGIGDLTVSFAPASLQPSDVYERFTVEAGPPALALELQSGKIPDLPPEETAFDTRALWSFYKSAGRYVFRDRPLTRKRPRTVFSIESDFRSGTIYARQPHPFPFRYPLDQIVMVNLFARNAGMLAHACGIKRGSEGVLFPGVSTAGKSTMSRLWERRGGVTVLNDDRVVIRKKDDGLWIFGTPWHGDAKLFSSDGAPLKKVFFIRHGEKNEMKKIDPLDAVSRLVVCSFFPFWDRTGMDLVLGLCSELAASVPCYELSFVPDEGVLDLLETVI